MTWRPIDSFDGIDVIDRVDLWLNVPASPRSMGWSDSFRLTDAYRKDGEWFHNVGGKEEQIFKDNITHWMPIPEGPA